MAVRTSPHALGALGETLARWAFAGTDSNHSNYSSAGAGAGRRVVRFYDNPVEVLRWSGVAVGRLHPDLASLSLLRVAGLFKSQLTGTLPTWLGGLARLETLQLEYNANLRGHVPTEFGRLTTLRSLNAGWCGLQGACSVFADAAFPLHLLVPISARDAPQN